MLLFFLALFLPHSISAQAEAQAGGEVLEFQHLEKPNKTIDFRAGDRVRYSDPSKKKGRELRGDLVAWTDSSLTVEHPRTKARTELDLSDTPYLRRVNKRRKTAGSILTGIGIGITAFFAGITSWGLPYAGISAFARILMLATGLLFNPITVVLLGIGIPLLATATRKVSRKKWTWRRLKTIFVRGNPPQS